MYSSISNNAVKENDNEAKECGIQIHLKVEESL